MDSIPRFTYKNKSVKRNFEISHNTCFILRCKYRTCAIKADYTLECFGTLFDLPLSIDYSTQYVDVVMSMSNADSRMIVCATRRDNAKIDCWWGVNIKTLTSEIGFGMPGTSGDNFYYTQEKLT